MKDPDKFDDNIFPFPLNPPKSKLGINTLLSILPLFMFPNDDIEERYEKNKRDKEFKEKFNKKATWFSDEEEELLKTLGGKEKKKFIKELKEKYRG
jgi:hypothetical protein